MNGRVYRLSAHLASTTDSDARGRVHQLDVTVPFVEDHRGRLYRLLVGVPMTPAAAGRVYQILVTTAVSAAPVPLQYVADDGSLRPINIGVWTGTGTSWAA